MADSVGMSESIQSCGKCGGLFALAPVRAYDCACLGRSALMCVRCAAAGLARGTLDAAGANRQTWELAAWAAIAPAADAGTEDDRDVCLWLLDMIERQDGGDALEHWVAAAHERVWEAGR